ncbi:MAG TPA: type IV pilus biogenesis/stability protein PilW [Burkholderiaceae bacterium]
MNKHFKMHRWAALVCVGLVAALLGGCASSGGSQSSSASAPPRTQIDQSDAERRVAVRMELAAGYFSRGQLNTALDEVKQTLALRPDMPEALNLRALIYAALGETALADDSFQRILAQRPNDADSLHNYGWFMCQTQRFDKAQLLFAQALAQPSYRAPARTWLAKGVCEARAKQTEAAQQSLLKAFELDPGSPAVNVNLAEVLMHNGEARRARFYAKRVNSNEEQITAQSLWLGLRIEKRLGNQADVDELSRELRKRYPQSPEVAALNNGRFDE